LKFLSRTARLVSYVLHGSRQQDRSSRIEVLDHPHVRDSFLDGVTAECIHGPYNPFTRDSLRHVDNAIPERVSEAVAAGTVTLVTFP
jgi:hypothetical protein